jgi:hypothetical protein
MRPSFRAWFLIIAASVAFNFAVWNTAVILIGYGIAEYLDQWQAGKEREKVCEDEIFGWEPSKDDPEWEAKGNLSRVRLTGQNQIVAARIAGLLRRTL